MYNFTSDETSKFSLVVVAGERVGGICIEIFSVKQSEH